jgi:hypothetical protein
VGGCEKKLKAVGQQLLAVKFEVRCRAGPIWRKYLHSADESKNTVGDLTAVAGEVMQKKVGARRWRGEFSSASLGCFRLCPISVGFFLWAAARLGIPTSDDCYLQAHFSPPRAMQNLQEVV